MEYLKSYKVFESKNYGNVYHSIWNPKRFDADSTITKTVLSILEKGFKFSDDYGNWNLGLKPKFNKRTHWDFLNADKLKTISITRDSSTKDNYGITFVLDGNAISNNYKIEPCNLTAPGEISFSKTTKGLSWKHYNSRWASEEKILSKKDYLEPKFIKEIIINKYYKITEEEIDLIKSNAGNIKVTIIDKEPNREKVDRAYKWKKVTEQIENKSNLKFTKKEKKKGAKTDTYDVSKSGTVIGQIKWSSRMRGYAFLPTSDVSLDIKEYISNLMKKRKMDSE